MNQSGCIAPGFVYKEAQTCMVKAHRKYGCTLIEIGAGKGPHCATVRRILTPKEANTGIIDGNYYVIFYVIFHVICYVMIFMRRAFATA